MSNLTRRNFLGAAAVMAGGLTGLQKVVGAERGQNPDSIWPPSTDSKSLVQNFKYPFSFANKRTHEGGWSREVTVRELPVSKTLAGVNMRLTAGGFRELHWHTASQWAIML
jgi:oxalate decarboxylase